MDDWGLHYFPVLVNLCQRTNQDVSSPVSDVYHYIIIKVLTSTQHAGGKFKHNGLILFSLDGCGYVWLM
jgi:hypothetical protein